MTLSGGCSIGMSEIVGERTTVTMVTSDCGLSLTVGASQKKWVISNSYQSKDNNYRVWKNVNKMNHIKIHLFCNHKAYA